MEKINEEQIERLYEILNKYYIQLDWIKKVCNITNIRDMSVWQYNYLLMIIKQVKEING
ncbi:MAG: hypothetical protein IKE89_02220 [Bacilli bacterium]|nr:hypothetical protein [Bacilli bacterium]